MQIKFRRFDFAKDLSGFYQMYMSEKEQPNISHAFCINTMREFEKWMINRMETHYFHEFFTITNSTDNTIGYVYSYEYFYNDLHCKTALIMLPQYQNTGYGAIAGVKFIDYLFRKYPIKKVFTSVFEYNERSLNMHKSGLFKYEGAMSDYKYWEGKFYSLLNYSITRNDFYSRFTKILKRYC